MTKPTTSPFKDKVSAAALRLLDALLVRNPERTAIGVAVGLGLHGILGICQPLVVATGVDLSKLEWWESGSIGLVLVHLPFVIWSVRHKPLISDELESLIELIESTNIGEMEKRVAYRKVVNKCIDEFSLSAQRGTIKNIVTEEMRDLEQRAE